MTLTPEMASMFAKFNDQMQKRKARRENDEDTLDSSDEESLCSDKKEELKQELLKDLEKMKVFIPKQDNTLQVTPSTEQTETEKREDVFKKMFEKYESLTSPLDKMEYLKTLEPANKVALREIYLKWFLDLYSKTVMNIQLITDSIYQVK